MSQDGSTSGLDVASTSAAFLVFVIVAGYLTTRPWFWWTMRKSPPKVARMIRINRAFWTGLFAIGAAAFAVGLVMWGTGTTVT